MKEFRLRDAIKFLKKRNNLMPVLIIIIGIVLMTAFGGTDRKKEVRTTIDTAAEEARLADILSRIDGAGRVKVMITYNGTTEQSLAYETKSDSSDSSRQEDKRAVMSGSSPMVVGELYPKVRGVIVIAQGAGDSAVKRSLTEAAATAMGVGTSAVRVYKSEQEGKIK